MQKTNNTRTRRLSTEDATREIARNFILLCSLLLVTLLPASCASGMNDASSSVDPLLAVPTVELPADWQTVERLTFERMVAETIPGDSGQVFDTKTLGLLSAELRNKEQDLRAAIWLARSRNSSSAEVLLKKLEERTLSADRGGDAADVIAAAGLAEFDSAPSHAARLSSLAAGEAPHPDLEVRVECARSALLLGDDRPIEFLLSVLLIGTHKGRESGEFWPAPLRSAWARERAAEILAWRSGLQNRYSADASIGDREREAARLALQLPISSK